MAHIDPTVLFITPVILLSLLTLAFFIKNYPIGLLAGFGFLSWGVVVLIDGIHDLSVLESLIIGSIAFGVGAYVFVVGSIDYIQELKA